MADPWLRGGPWAGWSGSRSCAKSCNYDTTNAKFVIEIILFGVKLITLKENKKRQHIYNKRETQLTLLMAKHELKRHVNNTHRLQWLVPLTRAFSGVSIYIVMNPKNGCKKLNDLMTKVQIKVEQINVIIALFIHWR